MDPSTDAEGTSKSPSNLSPKAPAADVVDGLRHLTKPSKAKVYDLFQCAAKWVKDKHRESGVNQSVLLRLYGLYKRSTAGACNVRQPALMLEPVARERYNAWRAVTDLSEETAMREYIDMVRLHFPAFKGQFDEEYHALLQDVDALTQENRHLLRETSALLHTLRSTHETQIFKRGHLYRWRAEQIGFASAKWLRQYVVLHGTTLSLYDRADAAAPTRTIDLRDMAVKPEGSKRGGSFFLFSLYPDEGVLGTRDVAHNLEEGGFVVRLSTTSKTDMEEWVEALASACVLASSAFGIERTGAEGEREDSRLRRDVSMNLLLKRRLSGIMTPAVGDDATPEGEPAHAAGEPPRRLLHTTVTYLPHRSARPSVLSENGPQRDYQGFANLAMCVLGVLFCNQVLEVLKTILQLLKNAAKNAAGLPLPKLAAVLEGSPFLTGLLEVVGLAVLSWVIEKLAFRSSRRAPSSPLFILAQVVTCAASLLRPITIVWAHPEGPGQGFLLLFFACVTFLKLVSYAHTNHDLRVDFCRKTSAQLSLEKEEKKGTQYPHNLTLADLGYFMAAPTLCYQLSYPRTPSVRWRHVMTILLRVIIITSFGGFIISSQIQPLAAEAVVSYHSNDFLAVLTTLLHMAIPSTFVWLVLFYLYFHLWLNLWAELLRFGDRAFYKDWWNSNTFGQYWRTWNQPVHQWMVRHLFFPLMRLGVSKQMANVFIFTFSAVMHELLISVPCHMVRFWAFGAMMGQIPLVFFTEKMEKQGYFANNQAGNYMFWLIFCVLGQPAAVLLYSVDFSVRHA